MTTTATISALLLFAAGFLHSFSYMCRKLPLNRRPPYYPNHKLHQIMLDFSWAVLLLSAFRFAYSISVTLGILVFAIHFVVLPFVFQPPLARLFGFDGLRDYLATVDKKTRKKAKG